jgi:hypothetical protein
MAHGGWEAAVVRERRTPAATAAERRRRRLLRSISRWGIFVEWGVGTGNCRIHMD